MKLCPGCNQKKYSLGFSKNKNKRDGLQIYCKGCKSGYDHGYYIKNKDTHYEKVQEYRRINKRKLWEYLGKHPCIDCGETNPVVLEFDHTKGIKYDIIANLVGSRRCSWDTVRKEISKCQVRCANCHRIKTAKELGWYQFLNKPYNNVGSKVR